MNNACTLAINLALLPCLTGLIAFFIFQNDQQKAEEHFRVQCGHLVLMRACQHFGISMKQAEIDDLPAPKFGLSFHEITQILARNGIRTEPLFDRKFFWQPITRPCIVKLNNPNHFVFLFPGERQDSIYLFDHRQVPVLLDPESLHERFGGYMLILHRGEGQKLKAGDQDSLAQFDSLYSFRGCVSLDEIESGQICHKFSFKNHGNQSFQIEDIVSVRHNHYRRQP